MYKCTDGTLRPEGIYQQRSTSKRLIDMAPAELTELKREIETPSVQQLLTKIDELCAALKFFANEEVYPLGVVKLEKNAPEWLENPWDYAQSVLDKVCKGKNHE